MINWSVCICAECVLIWMLWLGMVSKDNNNNCVVSSTMALRAGGFFCRGHIVMVIFCFYFSCLDFSYFFLRLYSCWKMMCWWFSRIYLLNAEIDLQWQYLCAVQREKKIAQICRVSLSLFTNEIFMRWMRQEDQIKKRNERRAQKWNRKWTKTNTLRAGFERKIEWICQYSFCE